MDEINAGNRRAIHRTIDESWKDNDLEPHWANIITELRGEQPIQPGSCFTFYCQGEKFILLRPVDPENR
jgi:hypothetical protein